MVDLSPASWVSQESHLEVVTAIDCAWVLTPITCILASASFLCVMQHPLVPSWCGCSRDYRCQTLLDISIVGVVWFTMVSTGLMGYSIVELKQQSPRARGGGGNVGLSWMSPGLFCWRDLLFLLSLHSYGLTFVSSSNGCAGDSGVCLYFLLKVLPSFFRFVFSFPLSLPHSWCNRNSCTCCFCYAHLARFLVSCFMLVTCKFDLLLLSLWMCRGFRCLLVSGILLV